MITLLNKYKRRVIGSLTHYTAIDLTRNKCNIAMRGIPVRVKGFQPLALAGIDWEEIHATGKKTYIGY